MTGFQSLLRTHDQPILCFNFPGERQIERSGGFAMAQYLQWLQFFNDQCSRAARAGQIGSASGLQDQETAQLHHPLQAFGAGHRIPAQGLSPPLQMSVRRAPAQPGHQVPVFPYRLTEPILGFASRHQPMFSAGRFGLSPWCGRMGYLKVSLPNGCP